MPTEVLVSEFTLAVVASSKLAIKPQPALLCGLFEHELLGLRRHLTHLGDQSAYLSIVADPFAVERSLALVSAGD